MLQFKQIKAIYSFSIKLTHIFPAIGLAGKNDIKQLKIKENES